MKTVIKIISSFALLISCSPGKINKEMKNKSSIEFIEIKNLSIIEFEEIKKFILTNGDRETYRNFDNNNPHYTIEGFDVYLGADTGQGNINNEPDFSDFNQLTIADRSAAIKYYEVIIVRKGDIEKGKMWIKKGMKEEKIYLVNSDGNQILLLEKNFIEYLERIKERIKSYL